MAHLPQASTLTVFTGQEPASAHASLPSDGAPIVFGYDLVRVIGQGGMGVVWEAIEKKLDRRVALKIHREPPDSYDVTTPSVWTEALVTARIGDAGIVRVLDVGYVLDGRPYYSMDYVEGTDLATMLVDGPLPPRRAVSIAADMARAAAAAHKIGVVHRDLKPRNVIIDVGGRARVCDFGIAYDASKGDDPFAGMLAGSPPYMAPEQILGGQVTPQTDIWAIGIILFEMLTGERPFTGETRDELLAAIVTKPAAAPSTRREGVHSDLDAIVARCLKKRESDRFPSAGALFETLTSVVEGGAADIGVRSSLQPYAPRMPSLVPAAEPNRPRVEDATRHLSWSWRLKSSAAALWPFVAETDRFNKAVGLSSVQFTDSPSDDGGVEKVGAFRFLGLDVTWREYPFEWIRNREHSVFRWYRAGPLEVLWNKVSLIPQADGGTELRHEIWTTPRGVVGQVATYVELEGRLGRAMDRFYRHLDEVLGKGNGDDPFEAPFEPTPEARTSVERACARLVSEGFDSAIVARLRKHVLGAPDASVARLRPYELADAWGFGRSETLDVLVHAAHLGILEPAWDLVCPTCMIAHETVTSLTQVSNVGRCSACATTFEQDLTDSVELVFAPHPSLRASERVTYCVGAPAKRRHILAQQLLAPGETRSITLDLPRGAYRVAGEGEKTTWPLVASAVGFENKCTLLVEADRVLGNLEILRAGEVTLKLGNATSVDQSVRIELAGARDDVVSASAALTHPSFREMFNAQLLALGEHLRVRYLTFVFVEVANRTDLFEALGDAGACAELARFDIVVSSEARKHEGSLVPSSISMRVLGFPSAGRAVQTAMAIFAESQRDPTVVPSRIAVHDGRCLAFTRDGKIEFFGETLHRGEWLLRDCPAPGIVLSSSVVSDREAAFALHESTWKVSVATTREGPYAGRRITTVSP